MPQRSSRHLQDFHFSSLTDGLQSNRLQSSQLHVYTRKSIVLVKCATSRKTPQIQNSVINTQHNRTRLLSAMQCVDYCTQQDTSGDSGFSTGWTTSAITVLLSYVSPMYYTNLADTIHNGITISNAHVKQSTPLGFPRCGLQYSYFNQLMMTPYVSVFKLQRGTPMVSARITQCQAR